MNTQNNLFYHVRVEQEPVTRYVKTVPYVVTGWRLEPETNKPVVFILVSDEEFSYENDVVELYSEKEDAYFRQMNKYLFSSGLVSKYDGDLEAVDTSNSLTDKEIEEIASTRLVSDLREKLDKITVLVAAERLLAAAKEIGRPKKIIDIFEDKVNSLTQ